MKPSRMLARIEALRHAMTNADGKEDGSFGDVFSSFLDLAEAPGFFEAGGPTLDRRIQSAIEATSRRITRDERATVKNLRMLRFAEAGFVHGSFLSSPYLGSFFYFEREEQGLVAFSGFGHPTRLARITMTTLPEGAVLVKGPEGPQ